MSRYKNKYSAFAFALTLALVTTSATGCGKDKTPEETPPEETTQYQGGAALGLEAYDPDIEPMPEAGDLLPDDVADYFITALIDGDYATAHSLTDIVDETFMSYDDFCFTAKRSDFGWIINNSSVAYSGSSVVIDKSYAYAKAIFNDTSGNVIEVPFRLRLDNDNNWKITPRPFCQEDITIIAPIGTRCYLDDIEITSDYLTDTSGSYDYYSIPCLARRDWKTHVVSSLFGDAENTLSLPTLDLDFWNSEDYEGEEPVYRIDSTVSNKLFKELQTRIFEIYDALYKHMAAGDDLSTIQPYVSKNVPIEFFRTAYESGKATISDLAITDVHLIKVTELEEYASFIESESEVIANIGISRNWLSDGQLCSNKVMTAIKLEKIDDNWYLVECYPNGLDNWDDGVDEWTHNIDD